MASSSIRVAEKTVSALRKLSETEQRPIGQIVTDLVERYQEEKLWQAMHDGFAALRQDPAAWQEYQDGVAAWDAISGETLNDEPPYLSSNDMETRDE